MWMTLTSFHTMVTMALLAEHCHLYCLYNTKLPMSLYACDI
jgi:hypothetical protein